jgi:hypothetical protein
MSLQQRHLVCEKAFQEIGLTCGLSGKFLHLIDLNEPKILPCGINGCYKCIKKMCGFTKRMKCNNCNGEHKVKDITSLPTNNDLKFLFRASFINLLNDLNTSRRIALRINGK